jgi:hypothetical protein
MIFLYYFQTRVLKKNSWKKLGAKLHNSLVIRLGTRFEYEMDYFLEDCKIFKIRNSFQSSEDLKMFKNVNILLFIIFINIFTDII